MNKLRISILALSIATVCVAATPVVKRGRLSTAYHKTTDRLSNHKGKLGLAAGAIGTGLVLRVFNEEINDYVKPLIKKLWHRATGWIKRVFTRKNKD